MNSPPSRRPRYVTKLVVVVEDLYDPGLPLVDALARLQLAARRCGGSMQVRGAPPELVEVLQLVGLDEVLACCPLSGVEVVRQAEVGEELGVDEVVHVGDPPT